MKLIQFVASLLKDPHVQAQFTKDPWAAMTAAGLDESAGRLVLRAHDDAGRKALGQALAAELVSGNPGTYMPTPTPWPSTGKLAFASIVPGTAARGNAVLAVTTLAISPTGGPDPVAGNGTSSQLVTESYLQQGDRRITGEVKNADYPTKSAPATLTVEYHIPGEAPPGPYVVVSTINIANRQLVVHSPPGAFTVT